MLKLQAVMIWYDKQYGYIVMTVSDPHEENKMTVDGVMKFLEDLSLSPESRTVLIIAWRFKAATQCEFSREEFINGMVELGFVTLIYICLFLGNPMHLLIIPSHRRLELDM